VCTIAAELNERDNAREQPRKSLRYPVIQEWAWGSTTLPLTRLRIVRALKAVFECLFDDVVRLAGLTQRLPSVLNMGISMFCKSEQ